ncbi:MULTISPECIES: NAD(P)/FAD-dependent oxidoreductase [Corynebacterium]|uniref:FAD-dependent pyridine nucleotide-disulfide oxidoreductase n=1 Tax=Corynebacterium hadale TaxID=2026255 RepID=A0A269PC59_9CORY|nr:NAD(P)/FAD-dependent oxidoreductase [Corynebacterium hadale]PAJ69051.1 FAD-dependent pyridine nucleotide-disulfide oxidoreductase [Corynebacterium hadale]WKC61273.1 Thioredoxin reductase [Corynebacterium hadale]
MTQQEIQHPSRRLDNAHPDVAVIGGGFAGTAAAITLARAHRKVVLIDAGQPRNRFSEHAHGILGMDGVSPMELLDKGHAEFTSFGGSLVRATADALSTTDGGWLTTLSTGQSLRSRHVVVATGITDRLPDVPGLQDLWGTRVFHCPYCHGYEVRGQRVALVGGTNPPFTTNIAKLLSKWTDQLTFYPNGLSLDDANRHILVRLGATINDAPVTGIEPDRSSETGVLVRTPDATTTFDACFTGPDFLPNDALLKQAGCATVDGTPDGWVRVEDGGTSISGLWAAGNVVSSPDQVSQAIGTGAAVGIKVDQAILAEDIAALNSAR